MQNNSRPGDPPPPPDYAAWNVERLTPEMLEEERAAFNMEEYLEQEREFRPNGGESIDDLIEELERRLHDSA